MNKQEYSEAATKFGIDPESFGKKFYIGNTKYEIVGINVRARTLPIEARNLKTGSIKKLSADYGQMKQERPKFEYDQSFVGRKFEFGGRIFKIVAIDDKVYTSPIVADAGTGVEHRFGAWIFSAWKLEDERLRWIE